MTKPNISRWHLLGLAAVLTAGCMILSVGSVLARYRSDQKKALLFEARKTTVLTLGKMNEDGFTADDTIAWVTDPVTGTATLNFAVSNLTVEGTPMEETVQLRVRFVGSLNVWSNGPEQQMLLQDGTMLDDGVTPWTTYADAASIPQNTALYHSFGEGWTFRFLDEGGAEWTWTLPGGVASSQEFTIILEGNAASDPSLMQLQIINEITD